MSRHLPGATSGPVALLRVQPYVWLLLRYLRKLVAQRRAAPRDDLVTALVLAEEAGDALSEDEVIATLGMILAAGYETTVNLISSGTLALIQHPGQREQFQGNPAMAESAIEELLRYTSPLDVVVRVSREDVTIGSVTIRRGEIVLPVLGSANRDESQFPDADSLDISRATNKHLAFGMGAHFCLGAPLARLEGEIALTTLFRRFPDLRLADAAGLLRWRKGLAIRGLEQLPVAF